MHSSLNKIKEDKHLYNQGEHEFKKNRDFHTEMISQMMLKEIVQKAGQMQVRNSQVKSFIESQKLKQSEQFALNNSGQVLSNFFIKPENLSPKMSKEQNLASPSKSPYSFLNYEQMGQQTDRSNLSNRLQFWQERRKSTKIYNCNKIYILKRKPLKIASNDKNLSFQNIKINETSHSGFGRATHRPELKKISKNNSNAIFPMRSSRGRLTAHPFGSASQNNAKNQLMPSKSSIYRSSFGDQNPNEKDQEDHSKLIKLQNQKSKISEKNEFKEKQTNEYISFLRQRKQKLQNIMKVFDLDDLQKKTNKIERENLLKQNKPQNIAETYNKMSFATTDYDGNLVYVHEPAIKNQGSQQNSLKKSFTRFPKYDSHEEGVLSHHVAVKVKEMDDKTKNFLNQIFSSACGTPFKSNKKIGFNLKNLEGNKKKKGQKTEKNVSSKISLSYDERREESQKPEEELATESYEFNTNKSSKNPFDQAKGLKSAIKIQLRSFKNDSQSSTRGKNKENIQHEKISSNFKNSDHLNTKEKLILKTDDSSRLNIHNKSSLKQLQTIYREGYAFQKQRIHPNLSKMKKTMTISTEGYECNKIAESENQASQRQITETNHQPLKTFFEAFIKNT